METPLPYLPDTGDLLFTRGNSLFNRISCRLTGPASHQATFYDDGNIVEADKSRNRVVKRSANAVFADLYRDHKEWIMFHWLTPLTPAVRAKIQCDLLEATEFERYSSIELPLQLADVLWNRHIRRRPLQGYDAVVFRKIGDIWTEGVICSKTSNRALIRNGLIPEASGLEYGSPSDTYRFAKTCPTAVVLRFSEGWYKADGA
jgi:hypothetical protein